MNVHEYQGKEILRKFGVATPNGRTLFLDSPRRTRRRASSGGKVWVVKAQIHAGGRGKGGGVKVAKSLDEVHRIRLEDPRHDPGHPPDGPARAGSCADCWSRKARDIRKELYVGMVVDRATQRVTLMASSRGRHGDRGGCRAHAGEASTRSPSIRLGRPDRCTRPMTSRARSACPRRRSRRRGPSCTVCTAPSSNATHRSRRSIR